MILDPVPAGRIRSFGDFLIAMEAEAATKPTSSWLADHATTIRRNHADAVAEWSNQITGRV